MTSLLRISRALLLAFLSSGLAMADDYAPYPSTSGYPEILAQMDAVRAQAIKNQRLIMYVLGANWCHDSTDFVRKLEADEVSALIDERYEVQLINVGAMEYIRDIVARYDVPVIYGTPTVLVVEPVSNTLLNRDSHAYWRSAETLSNADMLDYFGDWEPGIEIAPVERLPGNLSATLAAIDGFEAAQAERIYIAFAELGQMMREAGDERPGGDFMVKWMNLATMRSAITADLQALRASAYAQDKAGSEKIELSFPGYTLFIDDNKTGLVRE